MRVSYEWLKSMVDVPADPAELVAEFTRTGTEVEAVEKVGANLEHVVTAQVVSKKPHPDSDHMWLCQVSVGDKNVDADGNPVPLQIVCGAQNFNEGDHIVTAMIGAVLPGDFKIKKSKLRGVESCGMNCSARELGLSGDAVTYESAAVWGATLPGRPLAHTTGTPRAWAAEWSTPPGSEARSITQAPSRRADSSSTPSRGAGTVFTTRWGQCSHSPMPRMGSASRPKLLARARWAGFRAKMHTLAPRAWRRIPRACPTRPKPKIQMRALWMVVGMRSMARPMAPSAVGMALSNVSSSRA